MLMRMNDIARGNRGFQLVELLIVIALISILATIGVPAILGQMRHLRLSRSVRDLATELNAARIRAIAQNTRYRVSVTQGTPDVYVLQTYTLTLVNNVWTPTGPWAAVPGHGQKSVEAGIDISAPAGDFLVEFYPNGMATAASICLGDTASATDKMKITVQNSTGMITVTTGC